MKIDDVVFWIVAAVSALVAAVYLLALAVGAVATGGLTLPLLGVALVVLAVFGVVVRQRLRNAEDDRYDRIEK